MKTFAALFCFVMMLQEAPIITVDVHLQQVVATVRDASGKIVKGLRKEDFIIEDNAVPQTIVHFSDDPDAPLSLGILLDTSESMSSMPGGTVSGIAAETGITRVLLKHLKPDDEISLMTFTGSVSVRHGFTKDRRRIEDALDGLKAGGTTGLLSSIDRALVEVKSSKYPKRALIVMADAYFNGDLNKVAGDLRRAEVPIFAFAMRGVDFGPEVQACTSACHQFEILPGPIVQNLPGIMVGGFGVRDQTHEFLNMLATETGGRTTVFEMHPRETMLRINAAIDEIAAELRGQYLLGYYPSAPADPTNRTIRVRTVTPGYRVYTRREDQKLR